MTFDLFTRLLAYPESFQKPIATAYTWRMTHSNKKANLSLVWGTYVSQSSVWLWKKLLFCWDWKSCCVGMRDVSQKNATHILAHLKQFSKSNEQKAYKNNLDLDLISFGDNFFFWFSHCLGALWILYILIHEETFSFYSDSLLRLATLLWFLRLLEKRFV